MTPSNLISREALVTDHDDILNITKHEKLYYGRDYLPHHLKEWLEQGIDKQSNRRNLVFLLENRIVGFTSFHFQYGGTVVEASGKRISKDIRGKGFGRKISELSIEYLKNNYPYATHTLSVIADHDLPDSEVYHPNKGELLTNKSMICYEHRMSVMTELLVKYVASLPEPRNENQFLTKDEFKQVLRNKTFISIALENKTLNINWHPILLKTEEDIEFVATMGTQNVLLEGPIENPIALSIFTSPFPVADGKLRLIIDFYTCNPDVSGMSVVEHLTKHLVHFNKWNDAVEDKKAFFEIFTFPKDILNVVQDMEVKVGVGEKRYIFGTENREICGTFSYIKPIQRPNKLISNL